MRFDLLIRGGEVIRSWILEMLRRPDFAGVPVTVGARVTDVGALRAHVEWLERALDPSV